jgi:hypothetical protein
VTRSVCLAAFLLSCGGDSKGAPPSAEPSSKPSAIPAATSTASSASSAPAGPQRLDLSSRGLPIAITVPPCAKARAPLIKNQDNDADVILACDPVFGAPSAQRPFAIQIGLAKSKAWKADIRKNPSFKRFTTDEVNLLRWEGVEGANQVGEFMLRQKVGATEYACFPQFPALEAQRALLEEELAACRSITAP